MAVINRHGIRTDGIIFFFFMFRYNKSNQNHRSLLTFTTISNPLCTILLLHMTPTTEMPRETKTEIRNKQQISIDDKMEALQVMWRFFFLSLYNYYIVIIIYDYTFVIWFHIMIKDWDLLLKCVSWSLVMPCFCALFLILVNNGDNFVMVAEYSALKVLGS